MAAEPPGRDLGSPIDVAAVLAPERQALIELLTSLDDSGWAAPTACPGWSVHELAVHLVHDDVRRLSAGRDGHVGAWLDASTLDELAVALGAANEAWVATVSPSLSPRLVTEILTWLADQSLRHLTERDPSAEESSVAWAGVGPHPNWLDVAREYTERWVHQQQIREAVDRPGLTAPRFLEPVIETFARALPASLPAAGAGTSVLVRVTGPAGRAWRLAADGTGWAFTDDRGRASAEVVLPAEVFWRRAVRMIDHAAARRLADVEGDPDLASAVLDLRAAIVRS